MSGLTPDRLSRQIMADFPTIFDWIARFDYLRGLPAAYLIAIMAIILLVVRDWRVSVFALLVQYLAAGLLFVDVLDPRLSIIKVLVGLFVCLILYFTARQVSWGQLPTDVTAAEAVQLREDSRLRFGNYLLPTTTWFRLFLGLAIALVAWTLSEQSAYQLPVVPAHLNLAIYMLWSMGALGLSLTSEPLQAGLGLLTFMLGFELFYSALEQSVAMLTALAAVHLLLALVIAYLTQVRHAVPAIFQRRVAAEAPAPAETAQTGEPV